LAVFRQEMKPQTSLRGL